MSDLWVFGYGSLMWRPDFDYIARERARIDAAHRSLCVYSWVHRGTKERPGLVFGLDEGGACEGIAYRVAAEKREETIAYLRAREQVTGVYLEVERPVTLSNATQVEALTYVVDRDHPQYAGRLSLEDRLRIVRGATGLSGPNPDYVLNTVAHLDELGIVDEEMRALSRALAVVA